jgi:hypothetical protein
MKFFQAVHFRFDPVFVYDFLESLLGRAGSEVSENWQQREVWIRMSGLIMSRNS